ncbi:ATP-binding protein [Oceanobacillus alkalisoli]|uniref:ATP-binding protein n=1 Tax=Oceanobacillus alkalisoli TaxID=2925113 RepID=UPI001EF04C51|nr:AAA family ATPase [Oceanobacillus alkalisoli]MCF3942024.1 AAA family ATPase [Oceanobacillus alkalisoli]MCG5102023.1 AAA family ATPase [Oceanobacillus alkalisoli]
MRFIRAKLFGFGKWVDKEFDFNASPLFIYGENESGKSTLHQFILFMLFGMQPKERKFYQPKTSSKLGGHLVMEVPEVGVFTIERFGDLHNGKAVCHAASGETYDEAWLTERLKGMNLSTYEAIFSFSALDLNAIKQMQEENLGDVLLSIGLTGSSNIYQIEKQLDSRLGELFKPYGKNPEINKQLQVVQQLGENLAAVQKEESTYRRKVLESHELEETLDKLKQRQVNLTNEMRSVTKKRTALPVLKEYQQLKRKQAQYEATFEFPANGIERLEKLHDAMRPLESELAVLESNEENYRYNASQLEEKRLPESTLELLREKQRNKSVYTELKNTKENLQEKEAEITKEITNGLTDLQLKLADTELQELTLPFYIEETWKQIKEDKEKLEQESVSLETEKNGLLEEENYLQAKLREIKSKFLPEREVAELRRRLEEGKEQEQLERLYEANMKQQQFYTKEKRQKSKRVKQFFLIGIIFSILSTFLAFSMDMSYLYGVALLLILFAAGQYLFHKQHIKAMEKLIQSPPVLKQREKLSDEEMYRLEKQLEAEDEKRREWKALQADIQQQQISILKWEEKERIYLEKKRRLHDQTGEQLVLYPFLEPINSSYWPDYFNRIKELLRQHEERERLIKEVKEKRMDEEQMEQETVKFLHNFGKTSIQSLADGFLFIEQTIEKETELEHRLRQIGELIEHVQEQKQDMLKRIALHQQKITKLLQKGQAATEEEFYDRANYLTEKKELEAALEANEHKLDTIFPSRSWERIVEEELDPFSLEEREQELELQVSTVDAEIDHTQQKLTEINLDLKRLEGSDAYSSKLHQFEMEKEKLRQLAKEWSIINMQKEILTETKQRYQEKYLARVVEETAAILHTITDGRYTNVFAPRGKETFQVMSAEGIRFNVNELSQGTMNQLYVALRFAVSKIMTEKHQLPFILDDAFVHFDELRVKRILDVLNEIAQGQQVIMFTCKSDVRMACEKEKLPIMYV